MVTCSYILSVISLCHNKILVKPFIETIITDSALYVCNVIYVEHLTLLLEYIESCSKC